MCKESLILQRLQTHFLDSSFNNMRALPSKPKIKLKEKIAKKRKKRKKVKSEEKKTQNK